MVDFFDSVLEFGTIQEMVFAVETEVARCGRADGGIMFGHAPSDPTVICAYAFCSFGEMIMARTRLPAPIDFQSDNNCAAKLVAAHLQSSDTSDGVH